jgi:dephospho-CoA kinase
VLRIGLTGGIASGKTTVARMFAELGADIIDTDAIAHELVAPGSPAIADIIGTFGKDMVDDNGGLDRAGMRRLVFSDAGKRRQLEAILHPLIRKTALARADESRAPYVVLVVPLLFETGFDRLVDRTVSVDCPESLQIDRLMARDNVGEAEAKAVIAAQIDRAKRRALADDVIDSGCSLAETRERVTKLHEEFLRLGENCPGTQGRAE